MMTPHEALAARIETFTSAYDDEYRTLDAEVAVLTKWKPYGVDHWVDRHPAGMSAIDGYVVLNDPPVPDTKWCAPHYSGDIAAAYLLIPKNARVDTHLIRENGKQNAWCRVTITAPSGISYGDEAHSSSLPLAITAAMVRVFGLMQ